MLRSLVTYFRVSDKSMEPFCHEGDFVLGMSYVMSQPLIGDVVVVRHPRQRRLLLKRVAYLREDADTMSYWVTGDNREASSDSRSFGWVSGKHIVARAKVIHRDRSLRCGTMDKSLV